MGCKFAVVVVGLLGPTAFLLLFDPALTAAERFGYLVATGISGFFTGSVAGRWK